MRVRLFFMYVPSGPRPTTGASPTPLTLLGQGSRALVLNTTLSVFSEATACRGLTPKCRQGLCTCRHNSDHIDSGGSSHLHSRDGNPRESSSCSRPGVHNNHHSRSSRPDRHKSLCSCNPSDPAGLPVRPGSLAHNRSSRPREANLRRIDSSRSSGRHGCNDSSNPCRSMDHCCNRGARSGGACAAHVGALGTLADNGTAPCVLVAEAPLCAAARHAAADLDFDGTESDAAAAPQ